MLKSLIVAFSTYSKIPMPKIEWDEKSMKYSMCFFPFVGAVIGLCSVICLYGLGVLGIGKTMTAAVLTALPLLINGGIHMDGFLDTMDAKSSYQPREEKLRILKDPHAGAFAIISGLVYILLVFGGFCEVTEREIGCIGIGYVYARILSGLSVVTLRKAKKDGMAAASANAAERSVKWILAAELLICICFLLFFDPILGGVCVLAGGISFLHYQRMAYRVFGGITGDLAGYFLQTCELLILYGAIFASKVMEMFS